jgi:hypothetical protein
MAIPVLSSTTPLTGNNGVIFTTGPYTNTQFAALLIQAYMNGYQVRLPNFEPFLQENIPSITSYEANGTVEGGTVDIPAQTTGGSNFMGELQQILNNHPEETTTGIAESLTPVASSDFGYTIVSGVVDILSTQPESYIVEIFTPEVQETDPTSNITEYTTTLEYQNTANGWVLNLSQDFNDYVKVEVPGQSEFNLDNED